MLFNSFRFSLTQIPTSNRSHTNIFNKYAYVNSIDKRRRLKELKECKYDDINTPHDYRIQFNICTQREQIYKSVIKTAF